MTENQMEVAGALKAIAMNETLQPEERRAALAHILKLRGESDDIADLPDEEVSAVAAKVTPWAAPSLFYKYDGMTLIEALEQLNQSRKLKALLAIVVNESLLVDDRLDAIRLVIKDHIGRHHHFRVNNYTPEHLLQKIRPSTEMTRFPNNTPISRPPAVLRDVWGGW